MRRALPPGKGIRPRTCIHPKLQLAGRLGRVFEHQGVHAWVIRAHVGNLVADLDAFIFRSLCKRFFVKALRLSGSALNQHVIGNPGCRSLRLQGFQHAACLVICFLGHQGVQLPGLFQKRFLLFLQLPFYLCYLPVGLQQARSRFQMAPGLGKIHIHDRLLGKDTELLHLLHILQLKPAIPAGRRGSQDFLLAAGAFDIEAAPADGTFPLPMGNIHHGIAAPAGNPVFQRDASCACPDILCDTY